MPQKIWKIGKTIRGSKIDLFEILDPDGDCAGLVDFESAQRIVAEANGLRKGVVESIPWAEGALRDILGPRQPAGLTMGQKACIGSTKEVNRIVKEYWGDLNDWS